MALYRNQSQYDELAKAELDLGSALRDWKDGGGSLSEVIREINYMIDLRVQIALENGKRDE